MPVPDDMGRRGGGAATLTVMAAAGGAAIDLAIVGRAKAELVLRKSGLALGSGAENMGSSSSSLASARCMVKQLSDQIGERGREQVSR